MQKIDSLRGYFGIGIYMPKHDENIGTLWRHAYLYNASFIFTIGKKYSKQCSDTSNSYNHIPLYYYETYDHFKASLPEGCDTIAVELDPFSVPLQDFEHPLRVVYLLGNESHGLPKEIINEVDHTVQIYAPKPQSMNVATSGTIVMYDRSIKAR